MIEKMIGIAHHGKLLGIVPRNISVNLESGKDLYFVSDKPYKINIYSGYNGMNTRNCDIYGTLFFDPSHYKEKSYYHLASIFNDQDELEFMAVVHDVYGTVIDRVKVEKANHSFMFLKKLTLIRGNQYLLEYENSKGNSGTMKLYVKDKLILPDVIDDVKVTYIDHDFMDNHKLQCRIKLPRYLKGIGARAFKDSHIKGVLNIPAGVEVIGEQAFENCQNMTELHFVKDGLLEVIHKAAFHNCINMTQPIIIPSYVTYIGHIAFVGCQSHITFSSKVEMDVDPYYKEEPDFEHDHNAYYDYLDYLNYSHRLIFVSEDDIKFSFDK